MPYGSYATRDIAVQNAVRIMKESGADAVKLQGGREMFDIIKTVADCGVPVMSHVGLCPHFVHRFGGFKMQGRTAKDALKIIDNARAIEQAGAIGMEIEAMPYEVGKAVDDAVSIFTFSIGAGSAGTCQMLNGYDLIGAFDTFKPKFAKRYGNVAEVAVNAFDAYVRDVREGKFPDEEHSYKMNPDEIKKLQAALAGQREES
jgi:3-methyl-2-oxobutanoate hydroxymethyltransferase